VRGVYLITLIGVYLSVQLVIGVRATAHVVVPVAGRLGPSALPVLAANVEQCELNVEQWEWKVGEHELNVRERELNVGKRELNVRERESMSS
jgi:hypothetical protein